MKKTTWGFALFETVLRAAAGNQCVVTPMESMPSSVQYGWASFCVQWQLKPELITLLVVWIKRMRRFYFCWVVAVLDVTPRQLGIKEVRAKCCSELFKLKLGAALKVPDLPSPASGSLSFLFVPTNRNTAEQAAAMPCVQHQRCLSSACMTGPRLTEPQATVWWRAVRWWHPALPLLSRHKMMLKGWWHSPAEGLLLWCSCCDGSGIFSILWFSGKSK